MNTDEQVKLIPIREASEALCISESTLRQWLCRRKFPFVKVGGRTVIALEDLKQFVRDNRVEAQG